MKVPKTMSTQHPDNVRQPFFVDNSLIGGEEEVKEAFYAFSHLKIKEQLWDCEGKEVDSHVVEKLLTRYEDYFRTHKLGKDIFITLRSPNPRIEQNQGKVLLETLESIPRNFDIAKQFYQEDIAPIFEVTIPMVSSASEVLRVKDYYRKYIVGKQDSITNDVKIKDWVGKFYPENVKVIPLIEDRDGMLNSSVIMKEYLEKSGEQEYQRVWLARSDPALNYGSVSAVLLNKIALQKLHDLSEETSINLYPIIGCGSAPFRGNLRPDNVNNCLGGYPSVHTFTLQSAFKYDFPEDKVREAVMEIENTSVKPPVQIDEDKALTLINKISDVYQKQVMLIAPLVNQFSSFIPQRRKRKLHIGLFGYSRQSGSVSLPRAIKYCASLYSLGIPPELLGLSGLDEKEFEYLHECSKNFEQDMKDALMYLNSANLSVLPDKVSQDLKIVADKFDYEVNPKHEKVTSIILKEFRTNKTSVLTEDIERAASIRNFLG
jgi:phosphoenolpyruvate carboxylase